MLVPAVTWEIRASPRLAGWTLYIHAAAAAMTVAFVAEAWAAWALAILLCTSGWLGARRLGLGAGRGEAAAIRLRPDGSAACRGLHSDWIDCTVLPSSAVTSWLVVLHLRPLDGGRRVNLPILADALDPDGFRRLRVMLRWAHQRRT